jgi:hypothetical protein
LRKIREVREIKEIREEKEKGNGQTENLSVFPGSLTFLFPDFP